MLVGGLIESGLLLLRSLFMVLGLPLLVRHAVDQLAALIIRHWDMPFVSCVLHPIREAIAAEADEINQVDILHSGTRAQMSKEASELCSLELGPGLFIEG